jgi:hypothetical protein
MTLLHLRANKLMPNGGLLKDVPRNQFFAGLAILALYFQLAAGALCTMGLPTAPDFSGFPICHFGAGHPEKPGHSAPQQQCAFCVVHCHAALALAPALHFGAPAGILVQPQPLQYALQTRLRFAMAAQPRGPPSFI